MSSPSGTFTPEDLFLLSDDNSNQTQIGEQNIVGLDLGKSSNKKQKKRGSKVWNNFEKYTDGNRKEWAKCNICKKPFNGSSKMGTTHLKNHFNSCSKNKKNEGGGSASGDKPAENSNQKQEISEIGEQNVVKETVGLDLGKSSNKKQKKLRSPVWENFDKCTDENGKEWAICNICKKPFNGSSKMGTTHLKNHFKSCSKNKSNEGGGSASGDKPAEDSVMDQQLNHLDMDIVLCQKYRKATSLKVLEQRAAMEEETKTMTTTTFFQTSSSPSPPSSSMTMETIPFFSQEDELIPAMAVALLQPPHTILNTEEQELVTAYDIEMVEKKGSATTSLKMPPGKTNLPEHQVPKALTPDWTQDPVWAQLSPWLQNLTQNFTPIYASILNF